MLAETHRLPSGLAVIALSGELNTGTLSSFKNEVRDLIDDGAKTIVVDCRALGTISSSGLAALLWARTSANSRGGKIYLTHVSALVSDVLSVTRLSTLLSIAPTTRGLLERLGRIRKRTMAERKRVSRKTFDAWG